MKKIDWKKEFENSNLTYTEMKSLERKGRIVKHLPIFIPMIVLLSLGVLFIIMALVLYLFGLENLTSTLFVLGALTLSPTIIFLLITLYLIRPTDAKKYHEKSNGKNFSKILGEDEDPKKDVIISKNKSNLSSSLFGDDAKKDSNNKNEENDSPF